MLEKSCIVKILQKNDILWENNIQTWNDTFSFKKT